MDLMVIEGDGIGPEIIKSALEVLNVLKENFNINLDPVLYDINSRNIANGKWKIEKILELANKHKAILKAPVGDPKIRNEYSTEVGIDAVLILRFKLDLYANIRPVKLLPGIQSCLRNYNEEGSIDYTIIRENSEGLYSSHFGGIRLRDEVAIDVQTITRKGTERIAKVAYEFARKTNGRPKDGKKVVTVVDKSNVLKSFAFFREVVKEVAKNYPDIETEYLYADATAQEMVLRPNRFNVIVTENMFGDILSDLAAATVGGLGVAYSANISDNQGMFEPVHGTAPDIAGKDIANPIAMLLSTCLMLDFLGYNKESKFVENSILNLLRKGIKTPDLGGKYSTSNFTKELINEILNHKD